MNAAPVLLKWVSVNVNIDGDKIFCRLLKQQLKEVDRAEGLLRKAHKAALLQGAFSFWILLTTRAAR